MGFPHSSTRDFEYHIRKLLHHLNNIELIEGLEAGFCQLQEAQQQQQAPFLAQKIRNKLDSYEELERSLRLIDKHRNWIENGLSKLDQVDKKEIHRMLKRIHKLRFKFAPSGLFKTKGLVAHQERLAILLDKNRFKEFVEGYKYLQKIYEKTSDDMRKVMRDEKQIAEHMHDEGKARHLVHAAYNRGPKGLARVAAGVLVALGLAENAQSSQKAAPQKAPIKKESRS